MNRKQSNKREFSQAKQFIKGEIKQTLKGKTYKRRKVENVYVKDNRETKTIEGYVTIVPNKEEVKALANSDEPIAVKRTLIPIKEEKGRTDFSNYVEAKEEYSLVDGDTLEIKISVPYEDIQRKLRENKQK